MSAAIIWFRNDLRISDQPALCAAVQRGGPVIPLFIWSPEEEGDWPPGACSQWWLHHSLTRLQEQCTALGSPLVIRRGTAISVLQEVVHETGAQAVFWNRRYEPAIRQRDQELKATLKQQGLHVESFNGSLLIEPWEVQTQQGKPYQVFTPFWKACQSRRERRQPLDAPAALSGPATALASLPLADLKLLPTRNWDAALLDHWTPGELGAEHALQRFVSQLVGDYHTGRDRPDKQATSRLSPHLHFGEVTPCQVEQTLLTQRVNFESPGVRTFVNELGWREFAHHVLFHFPQTPREPLRAHFRNFPWIENSSWLRAWQRGRTGYPIIDAGMRELWTTGWMHNRVRMLVGSFLTKDLLLPWQAGARWFWDTLLDADLPNNTLGWQWISGCGADAAPYFRVFNPITQGEKFDPAGVYVRRWCPELADLPNRWIHQPWNAPEAVLRQAKVTLGHDYPAPIVDHAAARAAALAAFAQVKQ